jgi:hypothetical protein
MTPRVEVDETRDSVLAGLLALPDADDVFRRAFQEAAARETTLAVLATGAAAAPDHEIELHEAITRWGEKYPGVTVSVTRRPNFDPAIALTAATTRCAVAVVARPTGGQAAAIVASVMRRAHCPVVVQGAVR